MSLRTRINGFTAWVNLRLVPYDTLLTNVLTDLMKGVHVQQLLHSLTGKSLKKLQSLDGLTQAQKVTRLEWMVEELKKSEVLPEEVKIDCRMVAMKAADHLFDLLWRLVAHDIWFTWERMEFLQLGDDKALSAVPFRWTPDPPPKKKRRRVTRTADSMMSGFGSSSQVVKEATTPSPDTDDYDKFPGAEIMKASKSHLPRGGLYSYPSPDECILDMINSQLQTVSEGHKFTVFSLDDLVDSRALCGLINSFIPGTFTTEVMLNDRWTINLALQTIGKMLYASNPMGSEDFSEADPKSICAYLCFFFMSSFKVRQSKAVIRRLKELTLLIQETEGELKKFPDEIKSRQELARKKELQGSLDSHYEEQKTIKNAYDIPYMQEWLAHISQVQKETRKTIADKMKERFDCLKLPRSMTINELCMSVAINLQLTQGAGFYRSYDKERETCTPDRRIVLKDKKTNQYLDDFTGVKGSVNIRELLGLPQHEVIVLEPINYPQYEIYVESTSRNKTLRAGTTFLYQVFPGNTLKWERLFFKAVRDGEFDVLKKMVFFFRESHPNFISSKESNSGNTVLHVGARFGHFDICKFLLENGCNVNERNVTGCTPLFFAGEGLHKKVGQLLIEWGCNARIQNFRCQNAFDLIRHDDMKQLLKDISLMWASAVPEMVKGRLGPLRRIITNHMLGVREMADTGARCIKGSTLLHTAVHFGDITAIKNLFKIRVDVNLQDYQGATPLHRAKTVETVQLILESNAEVNAADFEGNTALHVLSYGQTEKESFLEGIQILMSNGADVIHRNNRLLLPVHCAAMQGRKDVIKLMLQDNDDVIRSEIDKEASDSPPSLPYLSAAADHLDCAKWLVKKSFLFKDGECNKIMYKILTHDLILEEREDTARFLLENGGSVSLRYEGGNTCLHLAVSLSGPCDVLQLLLDRGAAVDSVNDEGRTPLFDGIKNNNFHGASILIKHGADIRRRNNSGLTPLDFVHDFDEWINCQLFSDDVVARFKAYKLKHARDLIRSISQKLKLEAQLAKVLFKQKLAEQHKSSSISTKKKLDITALLAHKGHSSVVDSKQNHSTLSLQSLSQYRSHSPLRRSRPPPKLFSKSYPSISHTLLQTTSSPIEPARVERRLALPPVAMTQPINREASNFFS